MNALKVVYVRGFSLSRCLLSTRSLSHPLARSGRREGGRLYILILVVSHRIVVVYSSSRLLISRYSCHVELSTVPAWLRAPPTFVTLFFPPLGYDGRKPSALNSGFCKGLHSDGECLSENSARRKEGVCCDHLRSDKPKKEREGPGWVSFGVV